MMRSLLALSAAALSFSVLAAEPATPQTRAKIPAHAGPGVAATQQGTVLSSIDVPPYTYIEVAQGKQTHWLAAPTVAVKKGDRVRYDEDMVMTNFYSKSLRRTFPRISFANRVVVGNDGDWAATLSSTGALPECRRHSAMIGGGLHITSQE